VFKFALVTFPVIFAYPFMFAPVPVITTTLALPATVKSTLLFAFTNTLLLPLKILLLLVLTPVKNAPLPKI